MEGNTKFELKSPLLFSLHNMLVASEMVIIHLAIIPLSLPLPFRFLDSKLCVVVLRNRVNNRQAAP